jgi:pimeloyl-ACP methyl ester carboxylesterase
MMEKMGSKETAQLTLLKIPSGEDFIIGRMYIAEGHGPHPTILLLHGFPGVMMNLDLAGELQSKGWNVLVISYRGAWGSKGHFSFSNGLHDVKSTLQYIKQPEVADQNRIDVNRIAVVGHSFGGFLSLKTASDDPSIKVVAALSGANFNVFANLLKQSPEFEAQIRADFQESCIFLNGCSADTIFHDVEQHQSEWNTFDFAHTLADRKLLITAATEDEELPKAFFNDPHIQSLEEAKATHLTHLIFETDHNYINKRKELALALHQWLTETL